MPSIIAIDTLEPLGLICVPMPQKSPEARAAYQKAYREKHAEKLRFQNAAWRAENAEAIRESKRQDYLLNMEAYKARAKASRLARLDEIRAFRSTPEYREARNTRRRDRYKNDPDYRDSVLQYQRESRPGLTYWRLKFVRGVQKAISKGASIGDMAVLRAYYREVFSKPSETCTYCQTQFPIREITIDHKRPFALGGKHEVSNLTVSCLACNIKKGIVPFDEWQSPTT